MAHCTGASCRPTWTPERRADGYAGWRKAVERTLGWIDVG
jgi:glycerol kinase